MICGPIDFGSATLPFKKTKFFMSPAIVRFEKSLATIKLENNGMNKSVDLLDRHFQTTAVAPPSSQCGKLAWHITFFDFRFVKAIKAQGNAGRIA